MGERKKLASSDTVAGKGVDFKEKPVEPLLKTREQNHENRN